MFKNRMDVVVRQIGCASRDEESIPVGSIYVDPRSYASPFKVHDLRIAHVTRVSNALCFINFDTSRMFLGKDLNKTSHQSAGGSETTRLSVSTREHRDFADIVALQ